jgi:hypothetical protein
MILALEYQEGTFIGFRFVIKAKYEIHWVVLYFQREPCGYLGWFKKVLLNFDL